MKRTRPAATRLLVIGFATVLAASCGGGGESSSDSSGDKTLEVLAFSDLDTPTMAKLTEEFEKKNPGVAVSYTFLPYAGYEQTYAGFIAARSGADVMTFKGNYLRELADQGALTELTDYITDDQLSSMVGFNTGSLGLDPDNGIYGMPLGLTAYGWFYNKELAGNAGLDPEQPFSSYDELVKACDVAKSNGETLLAGGNAEGYFNWWNFTLLWGSVADAEDTATLANGELSFTDPMVQATTQRYVDLVNDGCFGAGFASRPAVPDSVNQFNNGEQIVFGGPLGTMSNGTFDALGPENVGLVLSLGVEGAEPTSFAADAEQFLAIPVFAKDADLAWSYVDFITGQSAQQAMYENDGAMPNITGIELSGATPEAVNEIYEAMTQAVSGDSSVALAANPETAVTWTLEVLNEYNNQLQLVLSEEKSVGDALQAVEDVSQTSHER